MKRSSTSGSSKSAKKAAAAAAAAKKRKTIYIVCGVGLVLLIIVRGAFPLDLLGFVHSPQPSSGHHCYLEGHGGIFHQDGCSFSRKRHRSEHHPLRPGLVHGLGFGPHRLQRQRSPRVFHCRRVLGFLDWIGYINFRCERNLYLRVVGCERRLDIGVGFLDLGCQRRLYFVVGFLWCFRRLVWCKSNWDLSPLKNTDLFFLGAQTATGLTSSASSWGGDVSTDSTVRLVHLYLAVAPEEQNQKN